jgi:uncharacterized membrane protein
MTGGTTPPPPDERPPAGGPGSGGWDAPPPAPPPPPTGQGGPGWSGQGPGEGPGWSGQGQGPGWSGHGQGDPGWSGQQRGSGMDANVASGLAYVLTIITGVIFLVLDRRPEVRFHAMQAVIFGIAWAVVGILRGVLRFFPFNLLLGLAWFAGLILWVVLMVQGFQGNHFKLPYIGDLAEQQTGRTS